MPSASEAARSGPPHAQLLTRDACTLCEHAALLLERLVKEGLLTVERVDISQEPALEARYGQRIPVVLLSTGERFEGRLSEFRLRRALGKATLGATAPASRPSQDRS